jgi:hypothetical protein
MWQADLLETMMIKETPVTCPICKKLAPWVENKAKYGRNYGKSYMCYYCKDCDTYVGCHNNTRRPLGTMATQELRELRMQVHKKIDPLWRNGEYSRKEVYNWLSKRLGYAYHTGQADESTCREILTMKIKL